LNCSKCAKPDDKIHLSKCPSCHKMICDDCRYSISGRLFCSSQCAHFFFFEEGDDSAE